MPYQPLIPVRIVCTRDAVETAQSIQRLLSAEEHTVELSFGRTSMTLIDGACESGEAVLLIWSPGAPTTHYMRQWAARVSPAKLVEIARGSVVPPSDTRAAPVIDFSHWNGTRGGAAWRALEDRLRQIGRSSEQPKPAPKVPAMVLGLVSAMLVVGAVTERVLDAQRGGGGAPADDQLVEASEFLTPALHEGPVAAGGAITATEPASAGEFDNVMSLRLARANATVPALDPLNAAPLRAPDAADPVHFSQLSMMDRLASIAAPLVRGEDEE